MQPYRAPNQVQPKGTTAQLVLDALTCNLCRTRVHPQDLSYTVDSNSAKNEKATLLKGVSGYFEPGQMTAVVGQHAWGDTACLHGRAGLFGSIPRSSSPRPDSKHIG